MRGTVVHSVEPTSIKLQGHKLQACYVNDIEWYLFVAICFVCSFEKVNVFFNSLTMELALMITLKWGKASVCQWQDRLDSQRFFQTCPLNSDVLRSLTYGPQRSSHCSWSWAFSWMMWIASLASSEPSSQRRPEFHSWLHWPCYSSLSLQARNRCIPALN